MVKQKIILEDLKRIVIEFSKEEFYFGFLLFSNTQNINKEFELFPYISEYIDEQSPIIILYQDLNEDLL